MRLNVFRNGSFLFYLQGFFVEFFLFNYLMLKITISMEDFQFFHFYLITFKYYNFFVPPKLIQFMIFTHLLQITSMNDPKAATKEIMKIMHASLINKIKFLGVMPSIIIVKYMKF